MNTNGIPEYKLTPCESVTRPAPLKQSEADLIEARILTRRWKARGNSILLSVGQHVAVMLENALTVAEARIKELESKL